MQKVSLKWQIMIMRPIPVRQWIIRNMKSMRAQLAQSALMGVSAQNTVNIVEADEAV